VTCGTARKRYGISKPRAFLKSMACPMMGSSDFYSFVSRIIDTNDAVALLEEIYKNSELSVVISAS
jgi:hypothetical protein